MQKVQKERVEELAQAAMIAMLQGGVKVKSGKGKAAAAGSGMTAGQVAEACYSLARAMIEESHRDTLSRARQP